MSRHVWLSKRALVVGLLAVVLVALPAFGRFTPRVEAAGSARMEAANSQYDTVIYTVRRGDTLSSIARRFNTTVLTLMQLNGIRNADRIYIGQQLRVPAPAAGTQNSPVRINFPPGGIGTTVRGSVTWPNQSCYAVKARAGQHMTVTVTSAAQVANFLIASRVDNQPLKRLENEDRTWTATLPATGDYLICVAVPAGTHAYDLSVSIPPLSGNTAPVRIRFPAGGTSATVPGSVTGVERDCYVLRALAGQIMSVRVSSAANVASFSLVGADGSPLKRIEVGNPYYAVRLPYTQDYTVCVGIPDAAPVTAYYELFVSVTY